MTRLRLTPVLLAALAGLCAASGALAQHARDANPLVGSNGYNFRARSFSEEVAFRNAVITGNVASGRQFRGNVGYTAPRDFRGNTAVNDQFAFRADSFYSGLATRDLRNIDHLRRHFGDPTFGQTQGVSGGLIINRPGAGVNALDFTNPNVTERITDVDQFGGTLRSMAASRLRNDMRPELMARFVNETGEARLITSSEIDSVRMSAPLEPDTVTPPAAPPTRVDRSDPAAELVDDRLSPHAQLLESLRREAIEAGAHLRGVEREEPTDPEEELRPPTPAPDGAGDNPLDALRDRAKREGMTIEEMLDAMRGTIDPTAPAPDGAPGDEPTENPGSVGSLTPLEQALHRIGSELPPQPLVNPGGDPEDAYHGHMATGQDLLAEGQWFDAEERFTMALGHRPGDAMAAAGRITAQIGAGMFRSAGINIRNLYRAYPEMIPVRLEADLLPHGDRLQRIEAQLAERSRLDTNFALEAALVMTYLGHQTGDNELRDAGFTRLREVQNAIGIEPDPLFELLEQVWKN